MTEAEKLAEAKRHLAKIMASEGPATAVAWANVSEGARDIAAGAYLRGMRDGIEEMQRRTAARP